MITSVNVYQFMYALLKMCVRICIHHWILYSVWYVCRTSCHQCHCVMCVSWSLLLTGVLSTLQFQCSYPQLGSLNNHSLDDSFTFVLEMLMWALLLIKSEMSCICACATVTNVQEIWVQEDIKPETKQRRWVSIIQLHPSHCQQIPDS